MSLSADAATTFVPTIDGLEPLAARDGRPFWSVIVPIFNRLEYLKQCLDSILDQDPGPDEMEITVVDDASPNDLREFVEGLGRGRVKFVRNATNLGLYPSTNLAIRRSRGRWLHILHDDDWVLPEFYTTMRESAEAAPESVGVVFCMYANWDERHNGWWSPQPFRETAGIVERDFIVRLAQACPLNIPAIIYRRESFERAGLFREDLPCTADWEWYVRSAFEMAWYYQPKTLACYRVHLGNQSHALAQIGQNARDVRRTLEIFTDLLPPDLADLVFPVAREYHARQFFNTALGCLNAGNPELANQFILEALRIDSDGPRRAGFAALLRHPSMGAMREVIRGALLSTHELDL